MGKTRCCSLAFGKYRQSSSSRPHPLPQRQWSGSGSEHHLVSGHSNSPLPGLDDSPRLSMAPRPPQLLEHAPQAAQWDHLQSAQSLLHASQVQHFEQFGAPKGYNLKHLEKKEKQLMDPCDCGNPWDCGNLYQQGSRTLIGAFCPASPCLGLLQRTTRCTTKSAGLCNSTGSEGRWKQSLRIQLWKTKCQTQGLECSNSVSNLFSRLVWVPLQNGLHLVQSVQSETLQSTGHFSSLHVSA